MNRPGFELIPRSWTLPFRQLGGVFQPVYHRAEPVQSQLDALVVVVIDVIMHAASSASMLLGAARWKNSVFRVPKKLSIAGLSKQLPLRLMHCLTPCCASVVQ